MLLHSFCVGFCSQVLALCSPSDSAQGWGITSELWAETNLTLLLATVFITATNKQTRTTGFFFQLFDDAVETVSAILNFGLFLGVVMCGTILSINVGHWQWLAAPTATWLYDRQPMSYRVYVGKLMFCGLGVLHTFSMWNVSNLRCRATAFISSLHSCFPVFMCACHKWMNMKVRNHILW